MGEDLNRIQDSYYFLDYSYEVQVGPSFSTYINELEEAVRPTGFFPFGEVSIASSISAAISSKKGGFSDYTGDTASTIENSHPFFKKRKVKLKKRYKSP
jgi:hypothetical protein